MEWLKNYKEDLKQRKIKLLETPTKKAAKYLHKCLVCHYTWKVLPYNVVHHNSGCPECGKKKTQDGLRAKGEQSLREAVAKFGQFKVVGEYLGMRTPILVECLRCSRQYERPVQYLQKATTKCGFCFPKSGRPVNDEVRIRFEQHCEERGLTLVSYTGIHRKASLRCREGHTWRARPSSIEAGRGCPSCAVCFSVAYKEVKIGRHTFHLQGYEGVALKWMIKAANILPREVKSGRTDVQKFRYFYSGKNRIYYPDFQIGNKIVEVKSAWTAGLTEHAHADDSVSFAKLQAKAIAVMDAGFEFRLLIMDVRGDRVFKARIPANWHRMDVEKFKRAMRWEEVHV